MTWKIKIMGVRDVALLFTVAILAYLIGVLTSPAFSLSSTSKTAPYIDSNTQQISASATHSSLRSSPQLSPPPQPLRQQTQKSDDCKNQPPPGYGILPTDLITFNHECKTEAMPPETIREFLINELFDGLSPYDLFPPKHVEALLRPEQIRGWGSNGTVFRRLMEEVKPRSVIELGSFLGASAIHLGTIAKELGLQTDIFCFDDFRGWPGFRRDINIAYRLLRPGGVMFGHDYFTAADKRGVRRAVDLFARLNNLRVEPDGQHWIYRRPN
uniref:Uncharacterized protein n=1 Tax=Physcomitrium patens TaxID=3218 RepID=A0A7I4CFI7_PHYPA